MTIIPQPDKSLTAKVISYTQPVKDFPAETPEDLIAFCARVSSGRPYEERGEDYEGLLKYCQRNAHWSIFEMCDATVEINAPRDISRQALRHQSFDFQEFSQRYSSDFKFTLREARLQDPKNRQNSIDEMSDADKKAFQKDCRTTIDYCLAQYNYWLDKGVAKECCRVFLPEGLTMSDFYMKGSLRSWIHYLAVRGGNGTQLEHIILANRIRDALLPVFPVILGVDK